jgi:capsular polysaccharide biosynthesis protein
MSRRQGKRGRTGADEVSSTPPPAPTPPPVAPAPVPAEVEVPPHEEQDRGLPRPGILAAVRSHWIVAVLPVILLVGAAIAAAYARSPVYTADTRLATGRVDASAPESLAGFTAASQSLAEIYSRSIRNDGIINAVASATDLDRDLVRSRLSAAPIPETPVFTVSADAKSAVTAVALSNAASRALVRQAERVGRTNPDAGRLLSAYQKASMAQAKAQITERQAGQAYADHDTAENEQRLLEAQSELSTATLRVDSTRTAYIAGRQGEGSAAAVHIIERATSARSDRFSVLQLWVFIAGVAGVVVGVALALFRANRKSRRTATASA